jgi:hypothetical protein
MLESTLQAACYKTANHLIPITRGYLYAVPNGAYLANKTEAMKLIATGLLPGVADMCLDLPNKQYHGLKIELKVKGKKQSDQQKLYQKRVEAVGYKYVVVDTLTDFLNSITDYLNIDPVQHNLPEYDNY